MVDRPARVQRYRISIWLVAIHSALVLLLGLVSGSPELHDQSPLMLLPVFVYFIDFPVHMLLQQFVPVSQMASYLTLVLLVGGAFWFVIGMIVRALIITSRHDAEAVARITSSESENNLATD